MRWMPFWLLILLSHQLVACGDDTVSPPPIAPSAATAGVETTTTAPSATLRPFPFSTPEPRTPQPGLPTGIHSIDGTVALPELAEGTAVYLSLGDSLNYGCCADIQLSSHPRFAYYLSQRLNRPVIWVSLAGNGTLRDFLRGPSPTQLDRAEEVLADLRERGHDVVAITLSIGGNDLLELRTVHGCGEGGRQDCLGLFTEMLERYTADMFDVYTRLNTAKDPATPVLQNNLYDAMHCGRPGDDISTSSLAVQILNGRMSSAALTGGAFLVDFYTPFKGHACEYISGVDPTYGGYDAMLNAHKQAYDSLPPEYVDPWIR